MSILFALAMNENITAQQFDDLSKRHIENQKALFDQAISTMESLETPEQQSKYLSAVMPVLAMFL